LGVAKIVFLQRHQIVNGDDIRQFLLKQDLHTGIVKLQQVIRRIDAGDETAVMPSPP
jgi:hypothetical protein